MKKTMLILCTAVALMASTLTLHATTYYVNGAAGADSNSGTSSSAAKKTIQAAVNSAASGDTILVAAGTYRENVTWSRKRLELRTIGVLDVTIDGNQNGSCIKLESGATDSIIDGFILYNGAPINSGNRYGGGICCDATATIKNCVFKNNGNSSQHFSGGLEIREAAVTVYNCLFVNNTVFASGGAVLCEGNGIFDRCTIYGNTCTGWNRIGGIAVASGGSATVKNSIVWGNSTASIGSFSGGSSGTYSVSYSCIEGGCSGAGNISSSPSFADTIQYFALNSGSPCVNAGEPSSTDPDGSRGDMGFSVALIRRDSTTAWTAANATPAQWTASENNVIRGVDGVFAGTRYTESGRSNLSDPISRLTDGVVNPTGDTCGNIYAINNGTLTWTLPNAADLYKLRINTHWRDGGRDGVNLTSVEYQQSGNPIWLTLPDSAVSYGLNDNDSSGNLEFVYRNSSETVFATSVVSIRFNLGDQDNSGTGFTEFEVVGNVNPAIGDGGDPAPGDTGSGDNQEPVSDGPRVTNVTAKQRYPWNGMVDITCTVSGISGTVNNLEFAVAAVNSGKAHDISQFWVVKNGANSADHAVHTNGTYHIVWNSKADFDKQVCSNMVMRVSVVRESVQLWEGGPYWATTNIGADAPEEYGYYFWWGDVIGYKRENDAWVATDGSSSNVSFGPCNNIPIPTIDKDIATLKSEGWITADGILVPAHDAAHIHWGGSWRMPTYRELYDLKGKCNWSWTIMNGVNGYFVSGKGDYASNGIFLPCGGFGSNFSLCDSGSNGYFWSSVPDSKEYYSRSLYFYPNSQYTYYYYYLRNNGFSVRPVQGFTK